MKTSIKNLLAGASLAGGAALWTACGGYVAGGSVDVGPDYYGPAYGGAVFYGHPAYDRDSHVGGPPRGRADDHRAPEQHDGGHPAAGGSRPAESHDKR
jgi:hypothetical protein